MTSEKTSKANFPKEQYYQVPQGIRPTQIVLHHTVSNGEAKAVEDWWCMDDHSDGNDIVATPYIIEKDGEVVELYDPQYGWAYHTGKYVAKDKFAIGIEIINAGPLVARDGKYFWWNGTKEYIGPVHRAGKAWRTTNLYWAGYTEEQYIHVANLCKDLCERFSIPKTVVSNFTYDITKYHVDVFKGIISHHNIRSDKTDLSPAWDFAKFTALLNSPRKTDM